MTNSLRSRPWHLLLILTALATGIPAQCEPKWLTADGVRGVDGRVNEMITWDPDGAGPITAQIVMVGAFLTAGPIRANNVVGYDPVTKTWTAFGDGIDGEAFAAVVMPNGDLVVSGDFAHAGGIAASGVARWNGTSWAPLGAGVNDVIHAMVVLPNGDLAVGGDFTSAGGIAVNYLAQWDGLTWAAIAGGLDDEVRDLIMLPSGNLAVGGRFGQAAGQMVNGIAEWDGVTWIPLGNGVQGDAYGNRITTMIVHPSGDLYVGGDFRVAGSVVSYGVARWDGVVWHAVGSANFIEDLTLSSSGNVIAAGHSFTLASGVFARSVAEWNGTSWVQLAPWASASGGRPSCVLATPAGDVFVGGSFRHFGPNTQSHRGVARFRAGVIEPLTDGANAGITSILELDNGDVLVAGMFTVIGGVSTERVARWDGSQWHAVGAGFPASSPNALTQLPNGDPVMVGNLQGGPVQSFNGSSWNSVGFFVLSGQGYAGIGWNAGIAVAGSFSVSPTGRASVVFWNGSTWTELGNSPNQSVYALQAQANGSLIAGGDFSSASGLPIDNIARWDGASWQSLGAGLNGPVHALTTLPNGDLVAGGAFTYAGSAYTLNIARWDGVTWHAMGQAGLSHMVEALAALPNGDVIAGGRFVSADGVPAEHIARWNGSSWSALQEGVNGNAFALTSSKRGELHVGGEFIGAGNTGSAYFARYASTCLASTISYGAGCGALAGANSLSVVSPPWIGATFRSQASGLPVSSLVVGVTGLAATSLPLSNILPQALSGCQLLLTPDLLDLYLPIAGAIEPVLAIPNTVGLAGQVLHHQIVALELGAQASIVAVTSSNALTLIIGSF